jgi:hypothetical protein
MTHLPVPADIKLFLNKAHPCCSPEIKLFLHRASPIPVDIKLFLHRVHPTVPADMKLFLHRAHPAVPIDIKHRTHIDVADIKLCLHRTPPAVPANILFYCSYDGCSLIPDLLRC